MIIGAEISRKQAQLLNQYILALERQIAAEKREAFEFQKLVTQLTEENNKLTDQSYALKKAKEDDHGHIRWLEEKLLLLQRDIGILFGEKVRLETLLAQAQAARLREKEPANVGSDQPVYCSKCASSCKTVFQVELGQLRKVAVEGEQELQRMQLERDQALKVGEDLRHQRSVLLQTYKCQSILQLTQKLDLLQSKEQEPRQLKDIHSSYSKGVQLLEAQLSLAAEKLVNKEREVAELHLAMGRREAQRQAYQSQKEEEIKQLTSLNEQLLRQKIGQVEDCQIQIAKLEQQRIEHEQAFAVSYELFQMDRSLFQRQKQDNAKMIDSQQQLIKQQLAQIDHITKENKDLSRSLLRLQEQTAADKSEQEVMIRRREPVTESPNRILSMQALSDGVGILREAVSEQGRVINSLGDALRQREEAIARLEDSNSELRRQIISAINSQEEALKELTRQRERGELRARRRQKPYFFSRVTSYENELDAMCQQSVKPSSTGAITTFLASQLPKTIWSRSEGSRKARRSLVQEIIHLNQQSESEETEREMVKVFS